MRTIRNSLGSLAIIGGIIASLNFVHAQIWLELTGVSNGQAYLNLYNATNQVYAIWSTTNLLANWNVETEMWPTNPAVLPFTVPMLERQNLFVLAEDWTGVDSNGDGIPDWWIWMYFGNLDETATNLDSQGNTLLYDYTNSLDPNVIQFALSMASQYINTLTVPVQINLLAGVPGYYAVLVNDINQADANWHAYTGTNITVNLGSTDGVYTVSVGLRGLPPNATATWQTVQLTLNTVAPTVVITNPTAGTVSQPMIQVQGYANEALSQVTFDVSNATGIFANQPGYITSRYYDLNRLDFTTNWFQCYDIVLTNGLNTVTLHATDLAGNVTTTNFSFTLDYSGDTTPPALTVIWPQDGTAIGGSSFTLQAQVDDNTATVTAQIVDASGDTNTVQGLVERSGLVWAQNLPLAAGTSTLTITATDAAGNTSVTSLTLVQSTVTVTMNPLASDQQNQWPVPVTTGTVSDPSCAVTVNGVQATVNSDGTWEADYVLASPTGVASFDVEVYAGGTSSLAVSRKSNSLVHANDAGSDNSIASQMLNQLLSATVVASDYSGVGHYAWTNVDAWGQYDGVMDETLIWDYLSGGTWDFSAIFWVGNGQHTPYGSAGVPSVEDAISDNGWLFSPTFEYAALNDGNYQRIVQTKVMIAPRGIVSLVKTQTTQTTQSYLVCASAASFSQRILPDHDLFSNSPHDVLFNYITGGVWSQQWYAGDVPLPPEWLQINGQTLVNSGVTNADGSVWGVTVVSARSGATVDVTPTVTHALINNDYTFLVKASELYPPAVDANRDGNITFDVQGQPGPDHTSADKPYRFWINDDQDTDAGEVTPVTSPDYGNDQIQTIRDLEDFARIDILVQGITNEITQGTFKIGLKWKNTTDFPAIKLWKNKSPNGDMEYLTDTNVAQQHVGLHNPGYVSWTEKYLIPTSYWQEISLNPTNPVAHLLFEGCSVGKGQLVLTINKPDGTEIAEAGGVWLDLEELSTMYEQAIVTADTTGAISNWTSTVTVQNPLPASSGEDQNLIVFVHGINVSLLDWYVDSDTVFKRLFWAGFKGKFATVKWPCEPVTLWTGITENTSIFNNSEIKAYKAGTALKDYLTQLRSRFPNYQLNVLAHSQGNAIMGEAIEQGAPFDTYILTQGAMPASSYDVNASTDSTLLIAEALVPTPEWQPMGYHGVYTNMTGTIVSFYNPKDYVLGIWLLDQSAGKPNGYANHVLSPLAPYYSFDGDDGWWNGILYGLFSSYLVTDPQESRAMISRSRTQPVGRQDTGGVINSTIDLNAEFGFFDSTAEHSAEWTRPIQTSLPYYKQVLLQIQPTP